ncbi:MAG TPA: ABC transporter substrate-binding protein [Candidatus Binatia bacterium]|nr:ABC transporter substrate-binding protein [Candidatus Binatia bacterium]
MRKRFFGLALSPLPFALISVSVLLLALSSLVEAQQPDKVYRFGLLHSAASGVPYFTDAFRQGMREQGYVEGKNYVLEIRARGSKTDQLSNLAADLVSLKVDIILTVGFPATRAAKEATSTIPIVMHTGSDPVRRGVVASLAHPGGNITGVVSIGVELNAKRLELLAEAVPGVKRIAVLTASQRVAAGEGRSNKELEATAQALGVKLQFLRARDASEIDKAFLAMTEAQADALLVMAHSQYVQHRDRIIRHAAENRLPAIYFHSTQVESGGLITYGMKYAENFRRMTIYVDKILKGAKPANLPIERPRKFELVINLKTAEQIGITIPPNVLARATRVIR